MMEKGLVLIEIIEEISRISLLENKSIPERIVKFNEEFGEFCAEVIKSIGFTYKSFNKTNLTEEAADALQVLLSIILQTFKEHNIPFSALIEALKEKAIKWETKIPEYTKI